MQTQPAFAPALRPPRFLAGAGRIELRCVSCRYGVVVAVAPLRCPMCGAAAWEHGRHALAV